MKKQDEFGEPLCQSTFAGDQCQGHEGHYGENSPHFASWNNGRRVLTLRQVDGGWVWTDDGKVETGSVEYFINGRCGKY